MLLNDKLIVIVEDNLVNRVTYQLALAYEGAHLEFERWGSGTITLLNRVGRADLIILDLMLMNGANGYSLFQQIRELKEYRFTPIVAVSAADPGEAMARCKSLGFSGYIAKPINETMFADQIARLIKGEHVWVNR